VITWDDIPKYRFDFINTEQVFEHIPEPLETLRHLIKSLETNGIIKISVPTANDVDRRLKIMDWEAPIDSRNSLDPVTPLEHINYFKRSSIRIRYKSHGIGSLIISCSRLFSRIN
jgi:SAM-dependent methyltransferase